MKQFHKDLRTKCLIKIKKYIALFVVYDLSPHFLRIFMSSKGFKTRKIFLHLKQKSVCCVHLWKLCFCTGLYWLYWSRWMSSCSPVDQGQAIAAQQAWQGDGGGDGRWRLRWLDEHQYNASVLLLRGRLIFSMFFRIMSCNVTFTEKK